MAKKTALPVGDLGLIKELREHGRLADVSELFKTISNPEVILVTCADAHEEHVLHKHKFTSSIHFHSYTGGACRLSLPDMENCELLIQDVAKDAVQTITSINRRHLVALVGHYPCSWAENYGAGVAEQIVMLEVAHHRVTEAIRQALLALKPPITDPVRVEAFFYINEGEKKRTYWIR